MKHLTDVAVRLRKAGDDEEDLALCVRGIVVWMLHARIDDIEATVREALADEGQFGASDYAALRSYPQRLAMVEEMANSVASEMPTWVSHRLKDRYAAILQPTQIDSFLAEWRRSPTRREPR